MRLELWLRTGIATVAVVVFAVAVGCGDGSERQGDESRAQGTETVACGREAAAGEYVTVLCEAQEAAAAGASYDAYGFAEYFPSTQRAAVDAFCFVADGVRKGSPVGELEGAAVVARITRKAEADLKSERNIVAPGPTRKAIAKLLAVFRLESLDRASAERYVHACYR
jgi:hypothetical protein